MLYAGQMENTDKTFSNDHLQRSIVTLPADETARQALVFQALALFGRDRNVSSVIMSHPDIKPLVE
ncbi:MAG: hypothetical protein CMQ19_10405 [Gammaproteobacteria bacterium]|nr:hypothetical protein [Gammaproteobacteria bacterium]|tara:strand:+ start:9368 stop:9565 length:198 start_codon:yes stop_codon:yes gene_type:complete